MVPKSGPAAVAYNSWKNAVDEWDDRYTAFEEEMKTSKKASKALISSLDTLMKDCLKAFWILKKTSTNYKEVFLEVNDDKAKLKEENTKFLQNNESDGSDSEVETESMNDKGAILTTFKKLIDAAEAKLQCIYRQNL